MDEDAPIGADDGSGKGPAAPGGKGKGQAPLRKGKGGFAAAAAADWEPPARDAVFVGTVHQSKGLEWPCVFVLRMNEEEFPLAVRGDDGDGDAPVAASSSSSSSERAGASDKERKARVAWRNKAFEEEERRLACAT